MNALTSKGGATQYRHHVSVDSSLSQGVTEVILSDFFPFQVANHEAVIGLHDLFDHGLSELLEPLLVLRRHRSFFRRFQGGLLGIVVRVNHRVPPNKVYHTPKGTLFAQW